MIPFLPITNIRLLSADKVPHSPERKESHYLVIETGLRSEKKIGDRSFVENWPSDACLFPVDKRDVVPILRRLLKEFQQTG